MRSARVQWFARRAINLVMLVLLIAGLLKAYDVAEFASALRTWTLFPKWLPLFLAPVVPALEIAVALGWFLRVRPRLAIASAAALLALFTGVYVLHLSMGEAPKCGCLGLIKAFQDSKHEATALITRNGVLLAILIIGARILNLPGESSAQRLGTPKRSRVAQATRQPGPAHA